ncbi:MAG: GHKL domain-containing protein [Deltaproteobacteria bacterium]|nr:GHKL domain-containing protein [Deltaproteobacteria bacterium]
MKRENRLLKQIEQNGLILIAFFMVLIYWVLDSMTSDQVTTRIMIALLVIIYGIFTQTLINSRKAALEEKERTQKQLIQTEKLAALGIVAAGIAHEVKNPLAIIIQGVEFLKTRTGSDTLLTEVVTRVTKSALRADSIIKGLLSFTRQVPIRTEDTEITPIIEETLSFVEFQFKSRHIKVVKQFSPDIPMVNVDRNQMKQVFINILLNAIEATQDNGTITVSTGSVTSESGQRSLQIIFADTGCGIPADKIEKVFDPFYSTKDDSKNTGLGLSITKGIIDKHHGSIHIESEIEKGTRVMIGLPASNIG